jgi:hypothetical protein
MKTTAGSCALEDSVVKQVSRDVGEVSFYEKGFFDGVFSAGLIVGGSI